jgi:exopolyphosphatase / guanosine-5'-triphosphate,3'-diphosphate pyrophosphatase
MFAAVDLGSNSFRLLIGKHDGDAMRVIKSARDQIRLASDLDSEGCLSANGIERALISLRGLSLILSAYSLDAVRVVATAVFRAAQNSADFLPRAEAAIGYPIEIISGEEEGRLIYFGVANHLTLPGERRLVIDIGGGSTELILGRGHEIERVESFPVGTVSQSSTYFGDGKLSSAQFDAAMLATRSTFEDAARPFLPEFWKTAYASSGTMRALSDLLLKNDIGTGELSRANLQLLQQKFVQFEHIDKLNMTGIRQERISSLVGGLSISLAIMHELDFERMVPIEAGLRMGVLWDLHYRATQRDRREQSVRGFQLKMGVDESRAKRVANEANALFLQTKPISNHYSKLVYWAALLHEVGLCVSQTNYHKHAAYMLEHADLPGFTASEQKLMSKLVLGQKGNLRKLGDTLLENDFAKAVLALRIAVLFLHSRMDVDFAVLKLRLKSRIEFELPRRYIEQHPTLGVWLQKEQEAWSAIGIEFILKSS